jgi:predicted tellurium resistance membrane protein TerC
MTGIAVIAVPVTVTLMPVAATPMSRVLECNPALGMPAVAFLLLIGTTRPASGAGAAPPRGAVRRFSRPG